MATLTVWTFDRPGGAEEAMRVLRQLDTERLITVEDGAWVSWEPGEKKPKTHQLRSATGTGAVMGGFWGLLFGLLFFVPLIGAAAGAAAGAASGSLRGAGIDDDFVRDVRRKVTSGTSALFLLTRDAVLERVAERFVGAGAELIQTSLSADDEARLRAAFAED